MLHNRTQPHLLIITQRTDVDHIVRTDRKRPIFVVQTVGISATSIHQRRFPRHTAIQGYDFTATITFHPGIPIPPAKDVTLLQFAPFVAGLPGIGLIMNQIKRRMIACGFNLPLVPAHNMQRHLGKAGRQDIDTGIHRSQFHRSLRTDINVCPEQPISINGIPGYRGGRILQ